VRGEYDPEQFAARSAANRVQYPPAEVLAGPQGGLQTLIFFGDRPPQVWEVTGDLVGFQP
jgi:hypothetical protein